MTTNGTPETTLVACWLQVCTHLPLVGQHASRPWSTPLHCRQGVSSEREEGRLSESSMSLNVLLLSLSWYRCEISKHVFKESRSQSTVLNVAFDPYHETAVQTSDAAC